MTKARRQATAALAVAVAMTVGARASAQDASVAVTGLRDRTIVLHVANYAALSPHVLAGARARVAKVYEGIGVRTVWVESEDTVRPRQDGQLHLTVILLSRDMAAKQISAERIPAHVIGQAHLATLRAYIFCDRIAAAHGTPTLLSIPLGNVIAHEMGHFLLRENGHSYNGIMRANIHLHTIQRQNFDASQASAIRTSWGAFGQPAPFDDLR